jgi:xanthine dehydrogenase YagT iron-sulfur-binding subunit
MSSRRRRNLLSLNGQGRRLEPDTRTTLLEALHEHLHLTGTKKGCDRGQCGACALLVNGLRINSCLTLAVMHEGEIVTIEGLGSVGALRLRRTRRLSMRLLHPRPDLLGHVHSNRGEPSHVTRDVTSLRIELTESEIRERMSGNICLSEHHCRNSRHAGDRPLMKAFSYECAEDVQAAMAAVSRPGAKFISGGTNLLDLMKLEIERPAHLVDISGLPLKASRSCPTAACGSAPRRPTPKPPLILACALATQCSRRRSCPAPRASCATRRRSAAT